MVSYPFKNKSRFSIIKDMWYRIKMWWFLKEFGKQIKLHTRLSLESGREDIVWKGVVISLTRGFLIKGNDEWPGLAECSLKRFSFILRWRKKINQNKINKKILEYGDIFDSCVKEKYISISKGIYEGDGDKTNIDLPIKGELYDESRGLAGLIQIVAKKFPLTWVFIGWIITVIIGILAYIFKP